MMYAKLTGLLSISLLMATSDSLAGHLQQPASDPEQFLISANPIGRLGGRITISERSEAKTLNPVTALDGSSREIISLMQADLIHINRLTQQTEPALATSWSVSKDGRRYTLQLRRGLCFSDGHPFNADDVVFTFQVYLDERNHSPQRDLLVISGQAIQFRKIGTYTVEFDLPQPYAAGERIFDSVAILPRHLLQAAYLQGHLNEQWSLAASPSQIAGLGPFQLKQYVPGQHIALRRNPHYWKRDLKGNRLPYVDEIVSVFTGNAEADALRFEAGDVEIVSRVSAANFAALQKHQHAGHFRLYDAGPGLEYNFLVFNLNHLSASNASFVRKQRSFRQVAFRRAVSAAIDRAAIVRLVYYGRASPLATQVTPANKLWLNTNIPKPVRSLTRARAILKDAGFTWTPNGSLLDRDVPVTFSIVFNAGNPQHTEIATLLQADLSQLGIGAKVVPLEFHALLNRVFKSYQYDAAIMSLLSGDADPNSDLNVWSLNGSTHVWNLTPQSAAAPWESEIDSLMRKQMTTLDPRLRKKLYDQVQQLVSDNLPLLCLVSPDVLVGAADCIRNFQPAILPSYTLWNVEQLYLAP